MTRWISMMATVIGLCTQAFAQYQQPLESQTASLTADWPEWRWTILAGDDALKSGLPAMAESLYRTVLELDIPSETRQAVELKLVSSLIAQRRFAAASIILRDLRGFNGSLIELQRSIVALNLDDIAAAERYLSRVNPVELSQRDKPWYTLMRGLLARFRGEIDEATEFFQTAKNASVNAAQLAQFDALLLTTRVSDSNPDDELIKVLATKTEENRGTIPGFSYAREYAVVLDQVGQKPEAIQILQDQLSLIASNESDEKLQTLLLLGLIADPKTRRGQIALEEILREAQDPGLPRIALYMLAEIPREVAQEAAFRNFLQGLVENPDNPIRDEILILRARVRVQEGNFEGATEDAEQILEEFPASTYTNDARWLIARMAWESQRYRVCADNLQKIRESLPEGEQRSRIGQLIGDCYYENGDFETAAAIYQGALQNAENPILRSVLAYQGIVSEIKAGRLDAAAEVIDLMQASPNADQARLWRAEWNLIEALRRQGQSAEALTRLSFKLRGQGIRSFQPELSLRLMWLLAYVNYESGIYNQVPGIVEQAFEMLAADQNASMPEAERRLLASNLLLLEGRAQLQETEIRTAIETFQLLRQDYPGTEAAISSYLIEARYLAGEYKLAESQLLLREMADAYPDSKLAPAALLEAATLAEKQGLERNFEEAKEILNVLLERYPGQAINFHAKLQLGNLARRLNRFGDALVIYEDVISEYGGQNTEFPLYLAELYRADSLLAQSGGDVLQLDVAAEGLDRVLDDTTTPVDARIEAGYKQALIFIRQGNTSRARETLWLMVTRILKDPPVAEQMGTRGRYWMARSLMELGSLLESSGKSGEAREVYTLIKAYELPGISLIRNRLESSSVN